MSVLGGARVLARHTAQFSCDLDAAIRQLARAPVYLGTYDFEAAAALLTDVGVSPFLHEQEPEALRAVITSMVVASSPGWSRAAPLGRRRAVSLLSVDEYQCLERAGLIAEPPGPDVVRWWDELASLVRKSQEVDRMEIARAAEMLTFRRECERLAPLQLTPKWISVDDNTAGYDVLSYCEAEGRLSPVRIEVKATALPIPAFFLTRNEWNVCSADPEHYLVHVWNVRTTELTIIKSADIMQHIPADNGNGRWTEVYVKLQCAPAEFEVIDRSHRVPLAQQSRAPRP